MGKMTKNGRQNKRWSFERANSRKTVSERSAKNGNAGSGDFRRGAVNIFILFHLIAIACWTMPWNFAVVRDVRAVVGPYMIWSGLFQTWDMFAPNPSSVNSYIKAIVITRNHHLKVWTFPRMEELSIGERYRKERYRKFVEVLPNPQNGILWPAVAGHAARLFNNPNDPPEKVMLIQFRADITPGEDESHEPVPEPNVFYDDYVEPGDLR